MQKNEIGPLSYNTYRIYIEPSTNTLLYSFPAFLLTPFLDSVPSFSLGHTIIKLAVNDVKDHHTICTEEWALLVQAFPEEGYVIQSTPFIFLRIGFLIIKMKRLD